MVANLNGKNWFTVALTVASTLAPFAASIVPVIGPVLATSPLWARALWSAGSAAIGALYHLQQPAPR